jgi:hypothetical protein
MIGDSPAMFSGRTIAQAPGRNAPIPQLEVELHDEANSAVDLLRRPASHDAFIVGKGFGLRNFDGRFHALPEFPTGFAA